MEKTRNWSVFMYSHEEQYGEYLWEARCKRVKGTKEDVKRYICEMAEDSTITPEDIEETEADYLSVEINGLETINAKTVIVAEPEMPMEVLC